MKSHFITKDPSKADLFFLPFSIARLRHDPRVGVEGIQDFIKSYIVNISQRYPYWNRTGGTDHFYVACHSIGRSAMEKVQEVKFNAIQVGCSSSYFLSGYVSHKDASLPQIWPRQGEPPDLASSKRILSWKSSWNRISRKSWPFLLDQSTPQFVRSFFKYGEMTLTSFSTSVASQHLTTKRCLGASSVSTSKVSKSTQLVLGTHFFTVASPWSLQITMISHFQTY